MAVEIETINSIEYVLQVFPFIDDESDLSASEFCIHVTPDGDQLNMDDHIYFIKRSQWEAFKAAGDRCFAWLTEQQPREAER